MVNTEHNAGLESFTRFCDEIGTSSLIGREVTQYWVFERGYRSAVDKLIQVMETGVLPKNFALPKLQQLAEKLAQK
ncbi:MAG: hypothetical protein WBP13_00455 [Methylophilaceae bacterium]